MIEQIILALGIAYAIERFFYYLKRHAGVEDDSS